ncbi:MAG TPA: PIN domain-containing protein [Euzebya sp.]|nr:PIN domain-containing protein [Euzebya sp.]
MLFVDTGVWYAAMDKGDRSHARARDLLQSQTSAMFLTDHVLLETWRLAAHRMGWAVAERFFSSIQGGLAEVGAVTAVDRERAWAIGQLFQDQQLSLTDRTSFAVMERLGMTKVATFDTDFAVYRYGPDRERAFTLVN